jgi:hypothetical protein
VFKIDQIFQPSAANTTDSHTSAPVQMVVQTKTDPTVLFSTLGSSRLRAFSDPSLLKRYKHGEATVKFVGGAGTVTVTPTPGLEGEGSVSTTLVFSPGANVQTKRTQLLANAPIIARGLGYTITQSGAASSFDLIGLQTDVVPMSLKRTV